MQLLLISLGSLVVGFLIALVVCYFLPKEKIRTTNQDLLTQEQKIQLDIKDLENTYTQKKYELENKYRAESEEQQQKLNIQLNEKITEIQQQESNWEKEKNNKELEYSEKFNKMDIELKELENKKNLINKEIEDKKQSIQELDAQTVDTINTLTEKTYNASVQNYEYKVSELKEEYINSTDLARNAYFEIINELKQYYDQYSNDIKQKIQQAEEILSDMQSKANAAVESNKRLELERQQKDFYRLQLSDIDIEEIQRLRSVEPYLRRKEPLNKVIWKEYYEKPYTDLVGRVVGQKVKTGIYKITNLENGMVYVGQAVNIADRWKQHIRRGVGADPPTQNKLYPAMIATGVENFMFEIIEECEAAKLNEREQYWQQFYSAKSFGYSIK